MEFMRRGPLAILFILVVSVLVWAQTTPLRLKVGDSIRVVVLGFPDYTSDYTVLTDGTISGIGFGRVVSEGKTLAEVEQAITARLRSLLVNPKVNVLILAQRPEFVYVIRTEPNFSTTSSTREGGSVPFRPDLDVRQVVAQTGVPSQPELFETQIYRNGKAFKALDLARLLAGDKSVWNGPLEPGDVITIVPTPYVQIWVTGAVMAPGEFLLRRGTTTEQAIARAGGKSHVSSNSPEELTVTVRRGPETLTATEPVELRNGDTITVTAPQKFSLSVSGEVLRPGDYEVRAGTSIGAAVTANAGGKTAFGSYLGVILMREGETYVLDLSEPTNPDFKMTAKESDSIFVLTNERYYIVLGKVKEPGKKLMQDNKPVYLADALAAARDLTDKGSHRRVYVMRPQAGKMKVAQYNLDEYLKDGKMESNPQILPGDVILFGEPKGLTLDAASRVLSGALLLDNLLKR